MIGGSGPELIAITSGAGWSILTDEGERRPLACWAMVADPCSSPYVVGLVVAEDGETVELAPPGRYRHAGET